MESRIEILISCSPGTKRARQVLEIDIPAQINLMCSGTDKFNVLTSTYWASPERDVSLRIHSGAKVCRPDLKGNEAHTDATVCDQFESRL